MCRGIVHEMTAEEASMCFMDLPSVLHEHVDLLPMMDTAADLIIESLGFIHQLFEPGPTKTEIKDLDDFDFVDALNLSRR